MKKHVLRSIDGVPWATRSAKEAAEAKISSLRGSFVGSDLFFNYTFLQNRYGRVSVSIWWQWLFSYYMNPDLLRSRSRTTTSATCSRCSSTSGRTSTILSTLPLTKIPTRGTSFLTPSRSMHFTYSNSTVLVSQVPYLHKNTVFPRRENSKYVAEERLLPNPDLPDLDLLSNEPSN